MEHEPGQTRRLGDWYADRKMRWKDSIRLGCLGRHDRREPCLFYGVEQQEWLFNMTPTILQNWANAEMEFSLLVFGLGRLQGSMR